MKIDNVSGAGKVMTIFKKTPKVCTYEEVKCQAEKHPKPRSCNFCLNYPAQIVFSKLL